MKWTFVIQQKLKIACLLGVIMMVVVLFNVILQKNISDINQSVNSIYNDRLIPATDIFYLSESLHGRQLAMEKFLYRDGQDVRQLRSELERYNSRAHQLISKYEKTYLVDEESVFLSNFKERINQYSALEKKMLILLAASDQAAGLRLYETRGRIALESTIAQLSDLTVIQSAVGSKLVNDTRGIVATSNFLSDLQIVLAIVIGAIITALVVSSKLISKPEANFNLN
ncbi:MCP four helix bundle domain-containing protein [Paradesertivirga mongoliensis]|uniref:MCP four helix bundle domain-containing protein n=1 Tax=Paradesertivirga mongoliensis TaxID=2100740 RepID=A0ABW4ZQM5_9SPHI|nr:MCP four helix bundle domain-containing protein [Pedobacter mongoliensis]